MRGAKERSSSKPMRLDQIFSLFLLLAFLLFSLFYLQHILSGPPQKYPNQIFERQLHGLRGQKGGPGKPAVKAPPRIPKDEIEQYEMEERRDLGLDVEEEEMAANEDHSSADDVTFLFAAVDIGKQWRFDGQEVTFDTYLQRTMELISTEFKDEKVRLVIEGKHRSQVESYLSPNINVKYIKTADLRTWQHFSIIEKIRTAEWWAVSAPEVAASVQGQSDLYGPVVMHRLIWLRDLAKENPFKTKYFMWMDASTCTPRMSTEKGIKAAEVKEKARYFMDKFLITITPMYSDNHIHGCNRAALLRLAKDKTVCFEVKGWVMGGKRNYILKIAQLYEDMLEKALPLGCLGTEETIMSLVWYNRPDLFHVHYNAPKGVPFDGGDICKFVLQGTDWKDPDMYPQQQYFQEKKQLAIEKKQASNGVNKQGS